MIAEILPPDSSFSRAVYGELRPAIPRHEWPPAPLRITFSCAANGLSLDAAIEGLTSTATPTAKAVIRRAGVTLVLASPVALIARSLVRTRRWRDTFLYGLLPLLFAIPLMAPLGGGAMRLCMALSAADAGGLLLTHVLLTQIRTKMKESSFIAMVPVPGLRLKPSSTGMPLDDPAGVI